MLVRTRDAGTRGKTRIENACWTGVLRFSDRRRRSGGTCCGGSWGVGGPENDHGGAGSSGRPSGPELANRELSWVSVGPHGRRSHAKGCRASASIWGGNHFSAGSNFATDRWSLSLLEAERRYSSFSCHAMLLATGVQWRQPNIPGMDRLQGRASTTAVRRLRRSLAATKMCTLSAARTRQARPPCSSSNYANRVVMLVRGQSLGATMSRYLIGAD